MARESSEVFGVGSSGSFPLSGVGARELSERVVRAVEACVMNDLMANVSRVG